MPKYDEETVAQGAVGQEYATYTFENTPTSAGFTAAVRGMLDGSTPEALLRAVFTMQGVWGWSDERGGSHDIIEKVLQRAGYDASKTRTVRFDITQPDPLGILQRVTITSGAREPIAAVLEQLAYTNVEGLNNADTQVRYLELRDGRQEMRHPRARLTELRELMRQQQ